MQMIASLHNPLVKHLVKLRENKKYRENQGTVLVTGHKLVKEISLFSPPIRLFIENLDDALPGPQVYKVNQAVLKKITGLINPEPIAAEFKIPVCSSLSGKTPLLILDAIRDPGNMGTLLRTALAFRWAGVFILPSCTDLFHEKVIRASQGACFQLPWKGGNWNELLDLKSCNASALYIADTQGKAFTQVEKTKKTMLLLSNEAQGVSRQSGIYGEKITIPIDKKMESLNVAVAGAILMYFLRD
jgi:RNA methyltransferase, TrmH family